VRFDLDPIFLPAIGTDEVTQGQDRVDVVFCPVHSGTFETRLNNQFISALDNTAANRPTLRLKGGIQHLCFTLFEVGKVVTDEFDGWVFALEFLKLCEQLDRTFVLELIQMLAQPCFFSAVCSPCRKSPTGLICSAAWGKSRMRTACGQ